MRTPAFAGVTCFSTNPRSTDPRLREGDDLPRTRGRRTPAFAGVTDTSGTQSSFPRKRESGGLRPRHAAPAFAGVTCFSANPRSTGPRLREGDG